MFSTLPKTNFNFSVTLILSSAYAFNLDKSKILSFGKELTKAAHFLNSYHTVVTLNQSFTDFNPLPDGNILGLPKLKAFADNKLHFTQNVKVVFHRIKNIVRKEENAGYQHFLLFP